MFRHCILCFPILCYSFFPIYWAYLNVLYSCFRFYQDSPPPFSANPASERCLGWIIIKQPNNSSESLCPNDAIEIKLSDLFVTHAESVCVCVCVGVLSRSDTQNVLFLSDILLISFWPDTGELLFFFLTWGWIQLCTGMTNRSIWVLIIAAHAGYFSWLLLLHTIWNSRCANRGVFTGTRQQKRNYSCKKDMNFYKNVRL